jgi:hypothetical protein
MKAMWIPQDNLRITTFMRDESDKIAKLKLKLQKLLKFSQKTNTK